MSKLRDLRVAGSSRPRVDGEEKVTAKALYTSNIELPEWLIASAIGNAVYNAVGVRLYDLPLTPERVWRAMKEKIKHCRDAT